MMTFNNKIFKKLMIVLLTIAGFPVMAQSSEPLSNQDILMLVVLGLVLLVAVLVLIVAVYLVVVIKTVLIKEGVVAPETEAVKEKKISFWEKINTKLTDAVPVEKEEEILLDHDYDGIHELDNHLPPWWKWLFYVTIFVGVIYLFVYHVIDYFPLMEEEYAIEMREAEETQANLASSGAVETVDINNPAESQDPEIIASGKSIFAINCASCHAPDGGGGIGPNLADEYWLHGGEFKNVFHTVYAGVDGTSMIAWKNVLSPVQVRDVSSFVASLKGTTPANPKEPQGEIFTAPVQEQPADSTLQEKALTQALK